MADIFRTSIGAKIEVTLSYDLTTNTGVTFVIRKPDGQIVNWTATVDNAGAGIVSYLVQDGDLNLIGRYFLQPVVIFTGKRFFGEQVTFSADEILQ